MISSTCVGSNFMAGIRQPGFSICGSRSQDLRFLSSLGATPAPNVCRLMKWVRFGPKIPLEVVPSIVWQLPHEFASKSFWPSSMLGSEVGGRCCSCYPCVEIFGRFDDDSNQHVCVLEPAQHRAIAKINSQRWKAGSTICFHDPEPTIPFR